MNWLKRTLVGITFVTAALVLAAAPWIGWWSCLAAPLAFVLIAAAWIANTVRLERRMMREHPPQRVLVCGHAYATTDLLFVKLVNPQPRFREWDGPFSTIILCRMCAPTQSMTARKGSPDHAKVESRIAGVKEWPWGTIESMWARVRNGVREEIKKIRDEQAGDDPADWWKKS